MNITAVADIHSPKELPDVGRLIPSSLEALFSSDCAFTTMPTLLCVETSRADTASFFVLKISRGFPPGT